MTGPLLCAPDLGRSTGPQSTAASARTEASTLGQTFGRPAEPCRRCSHCSSGSSTPSASGPTSRGSITRKWRQTVDRSSPGEFLVTPDGCWTRCGDFHGRIVMQLRAAAFAAPWRALARGQHRQAPPGCRRHATGPPPRKARRSSPRGDRGGESEPAQRSGSRPRRVPRLTAWALLFVTTRRAAMITTLPSNGWTLRRFSAVEHRTPRRPSTAEVAAANDAGRGQRGRHVLGDHQGHHVLVYDGNGRPRSPPPLTLLLRWSFRAHPHHTSQPPWRTQGPTSSSYWAGQSALRSAHATGPLPR